MHLIKRFEIEKQKLQEEIDKCTQKHYKRRFWYLSFIIEKTDGKKISNNSETCAALSANLV
jgi:hypothetical protein